MTKVSFTLNYLPGGAQAGFMYGKSLGIFSKAGIDLNIIPGNGSLTTAELVSNGKADLAYVDAPTAFSVAARGGPITVVAPILQVNGFAIIALKGSGVNSVKDLVGKRLGVVTGLAPTVLLPAVLSANGVTASSIHMVHMQSSSQLGALLQHQVDAIVAAGDVQGPQLVERGTKINQFFYHDNGVPTVGESIVANTSFLKSHRALVKAFVKASIDSWVQTRANPAAAAAAEAQQFPAEGTAAQELDQIKVDLGLLCAAPGATHMVQIPDDVWSRTQSLLIKYDNLPSSVNVTDHVATGVLPSSLPAC
ncbi:MAG: ABC transporter substrate-binding protein [Trebonia sp.]